MTLAEALENLELEPGRTYRCRVRGLEVELRVSPETEKTLLSKPFCEDDVMLDPWCELPEPHWRGEVVAESGERFFPDIPEIPRDDETAA